MPRKLSSMEAVEMIEDSLDYEETYDDEKDKDFDDNDGGFDPSIQEETVEFKVTTKVPLAKGIVEPLSYSFTRTCCGKRN